MERGGAARSRKGALAAGAGWSRASGEGAIRGSHLALLAIVLPVLLLAALCQRMGAEAVFAGLHLGFYGLFLAVAAARPALVFLSDPGRQRRIPALSPFFEVPRYTVIVPLFREAEMAASIVGALGRLDYPPHRLEVIFVLEAEDRESAEALWRVGLPPHMRILLAPAASLRTKPRACNVALAQASGDFVVVYDAEDEPHPGQLRAAAALFLDGPRRLGCLQAPLRIFPRTDLMGRQFALEYAALFEVTLPALAALRLPFPLGGTSNHFRRLCLEDVDGWDAFNVTEDADIGFRLAERGWRLDTVPLPTFEEAPASLRDWLPQRTRWLKGYLQTWASAMRRPHAGGWRRVVALQATLGLAVLSSLLHGPLLLLVAVTALASAADGRLPPSAVADAALLLLGWGSAAGIMAVGARRAGLRMGWRDLLFAELYWPAQSLAAFFALRDLVRAPFRWDKTPHAPRRPAEAGAGLQGSPAA